MIPRPAHLGTPRLQRLLGAIVITGALACGACGGGPAQSSPSTSMDRETFIATYVDLRAAAVGNEDGLIQDGQRAEILKRHGVTEADLVGFATDRGADVAYMRQVWDEVERRLDLLRVVTDSSSALP